MTTTTRRARGRAATVAGLLSVAWTASGVAAGCDSSDSSTAGDDGGFVGDARLPDVGTSNDGGSGSDVSSGGDANDAGSDAGADAGSDVATDADGAACTQDVSNVGMGDFRVAFRIQTTSTSLMAVVNQRGNCAAGIYWSVRMQPGGGLTVETDNNLERPGGYYNVTGVTAVNDGAAHDVVVTRTSGMIAIRVDGALDPTDAAPTSTSTLTQLAPLHIGTDVCVGVDGTTALSGTVTNVCVGP